MVSNVVCWVMISERLSALPEHIRFSKQAHMLLGVVQQNMLSMVHYYLWDFVVSLETLYFFIIWHSGMKNDPMKYVSMPYMYL